MANKRGRWYVLAGPNDERAIGERGGLLWAYGTVLAGPFEYRREAVEWNKRVRIPAEDPEAVRERDEAHIDRLHIGDRRVGDPGESESVMYSPGSMDDGYEPRRKTRRG